MSKLVKFSGQMDGARLEALRKHADETGRKLSSVFDEMAEQYLRSRNLRPEVLSAIERSMNKNAAIYKKLAE